MYVTVSIVYVTVSIVYVTVISYVTVTTYVCGVCHCVYQFVSL